MFSSLLLADGQRVLLLGNAYMAQAKLACVVDELAKAVGKANVALEQLDRLPTVSLKTSYYDAVVVGAVNASIPHATAICVKLITALKPGGRFWLKEIVYMSSEGVPTELAQLELKTPASLQSTLKLSGLVGLQLLQPRMLERDELAKIVEQEWQLNSQMTDLLLGKMAYVEISAQKPSYEIGASMALPRRLGNANKKYRESIAIWTSAADGNDDNDDHELADENALLDDEDKKKPAPELTSRPSNCETRKKACKNCSCGRAEMETTEEMTDKVNQSEITKLQQKTVQPVSSCGSCFLGDAFRCASCPYLGMPAFKPGEQVLLSGNLMQDDVL